MTREGFHPSVRKKAPPVYHMYLHCKGKFNSEATEPSAEGLSTCSDVMSGAVSEDIKGVEERRGGAVEWKMGGQEGEEEEDNNDKEQEQEVLPQQQDKKKRLWMVQVRGLKGIKKKR
jgi:hypothetical protein